MKKALVASVLTFTVAFGLIGCSSGTKTNDGASSKTRSVDDNNARLKNDIKNETNDMKNDFTDNMNGIMD